MIAATTVWSRAANGQEWRQPHAGVRIEAGVAVVVIPGPNLFSDRG